MTDGCSTKATRKGMGLVKKKCEFSQKDNTSPWGNSRREVNLRSIQELKRSVSFMYKV